MSEPSRKEKARLYDKFVGAMAEIHALRDQVGPHPAGRHALEEMAQKVSGLLGIIIGAKTLEGSGGPLFALLMFTEGEPPGWMTWVSNAERASMIRTLEDMRARLARGEDQQ